MKRAPTVLFGLAALALVASFAGRFHAVGDTLAVFRPLLVAIVLLLAIAVRPRAFALAGLILAVTGGASLVPPSASPGLPADARPYSVYQKNLLWNLSDKVQVVEDIEKMQTDFVMLQELQVRNRPIFEMLRRSYPYQHFCPFGGRGGVAVLSRWPPTDAAPLCHGGYRMAAMQVATPDGPLWVISLHMYWPFPYGQRYQLTRLLPIFETLNGPVVVGGDFNMVPWAYSVGAIERATKTVNAGYAGGTFAISYRPGGWKLFESVPPLPIDHILLPESGTRGTLQRRDRFGSDHHGLVATFALAASGDP